MNRKAAPILKPIDHISFVKPSVKELTANCEWVCINDSSDPTISLTLYFDAATITDELLVASSTVNLLLSGNQTRKSTQIQEEIAHLGGIISMNVSKEYSSMSIFCLSENFDAIMEIVYREINEATFPKSEIEDWSRDAKQSYLVNSEKVGVLASRLASHYLYKNDERYSRIVRSIEDYDRLSSEILRAYHQEFILKGLKRVVCVGNLNDKLSEKWGSKLKIWSSERQVTLLDKVQNEAGYFYKEKEGAVQSALRIYLPFHNRTHNDFSGVLILQTILGGYFGSRLMSNIREDKGYTYGINSGISELMKVAYLYIVTDVKKEAREATLVEVKKEIERLRTELIPDEELDLVRNFLLGELLKAADGTDAVMNLFMSVHPFGLTLDFFNEYMNTIRTISAQQLKELAIKYLDMERATIVYVG